VPCQHTQQYVACRVDPGNSGVEYHCPGVSFVFVSDKGQCLCCLQTVDARQRVHRAIVQAQPPHLSLVYAGTQVVITIC
jgi:hypothetical protein